MPETNVVVKKYFERLQDWKKAGQPIVFWPGRAKFPHIGHIAFLKALHDRGYKLLIGNGSCYSIDPRNPVHVFQVQVMLAQSLMKCGIPADDFLFVPIPDFSSDAEWVKYISEIPYLAGNLEAIASDNPAVKTALGDFLTANKIQVLERDIVKTPIKISATDLRQALIMNDWQKWYQFAASGTIDFINHVGDLAKIRQAITGNEVNFEPGRQCVDMFVFVFNGFEWMVAVGNRSEKKKDFPGVLASPGGGIDPYENPPDAALREFTEETGVPAFIAAPYALPAGIVIGGKMSALHFVKMYSSHDPSLAGTQGGSSLSFMTVFDGGKNEFESLVRSGSDLTHVRLVSVATALRDGLAFQQTDMLRDAYRLLERLRGE